MPPQGLGRVLLAALTGAWLAPSPLRVWLGAPSGAPLAASCAAPAPAPRWNISCPAICPDLSE
eukprot:3956812-Pyramimonas_sp.AAC.1